MKNKYDVTIVGAGVGGLICGCYLAKAGLKTLIIDKNDRPGGCCVSFRRRGFEFDAGAHIIGSCGNNQILGEILNKLAIDIKFVKFNPTDRVNFPSQKIDILENVNEFIKYLKIEFPLESNNVANFFQLIETAKNNLTAASLFERYKSASYHELLSSYFKDSHLKNILSFGCGYLGLEPSKLSALSAIFLLRSYLFEGAYYPIGGSQVFSNALASAFKKYGGDILLKHKVKTIICQDHMAKGVVLENDDIVHSEYIVSNADAKETFYHLVGIEHISDDKMLINRLANYKISMSFFVLYIALRGGYDLRGKNGWYFDNVDVGHGFADQIYLHIPTLIDQTVAPKGRDIIEMGTMFPYQFGDDESIKKELAMYNLKRLSIILPGINKYIEFYEAATPMTIYKYTLNSMGSLYGWEQCPDQVFVNAFPSTTKAISNLFLAGHWTFPGGGIVSVAISGMLAAQKIIKKSTKLMAK